MKIIYHGHSGFSVEMEKVFLLFDYYTGSLPVLPKSKTAYIFVSHHHPDHMNSAVFELGRLYPDVHYILSDDIRKKGMAPRDSNDCRFLSGEVCAEVGEVQIQTLRSTDCGVAFLVTAEGKRIFHAGDLCLWLWEGMAKSDSRQMMGNFMKYVSPLRNIAIDAAFLTLDNRLAMGAYLNIDYYMRHFDITACIPMHYFGDTDIADRLIADPSSEVYRDRIRKLNPGEILVL